MDEADRSDRSPVDPDVDLVGERSQREWTVVAAVSAGGIIGALARYEAGLAFSAHADAFPWTTFTINVLGCALIGVLMVLVTEAFTPNRLVRPLLGTGVLGGFTTFSTYAVDIRRLDADGQLPVAIAYLVATAVAALVAVVVATRLTRVVVRTQRR